MTYFVDQSGCEENSASQYMNVEQIGHYGVQGATSSPNVAYGNNVVLSTQTFIVTPLSSDAVQDLTSTCSCGGTWTLYTARSITSLCSSCTVDLFRRVPGAGQVFGSVQILDQNLRFTKLQATEAAGWAGANLTVADYQYVQTAATCSPDLPAKPDGPNPRPSPSSGQASKKMSGGDVFILLLFLTIIVYFGGGMAYNFQ